MLWLDGEADEGENHVGFSPSAAGAALYLYAAGAQTDALTYPALPAGESAIRLGEYGSKWATTMDLTSGAANPSSGGAISQGAGDAVSLVINELMADNDGLYEDPDEPGSYDDWFEIYNPSDVDIEMGGMFISDNLSSPQKWTVPAGIVAPAGGYVVFVADGDTDQGLLHAGFSLSSGGEELGLFASDGQTLIDSIVFTTQQTDISFGRIVDGADAWSMFEPATPARRICCRTPTGPSTRRVSI